MKKLAFSFLFFLPAVAFAQLQNSAVFTLLGDIKYWLNLIIPILVILTLIYFFWGVIKYVVQANEETKAESKDQIIYGLIGIFVLLSIYGIINLIGKTLDIKQGGSGGSSVPYLQIK